MRGREPRGHERQAARRRDESARNKVSCRGEQALERLQTRGEFRPAFPPPRHDRTGRRQTTISPFSHPRPYPPSSVKLPYTVVVDCFRCNYNFDFGGLSSDIIINYRVGRRARRKHSWTRREVRRGINARAGLLW